MRLHIHKWATYDIAEWDGKPTIITQSCEKCPAERQLIERLQNKTNDGGRDE